GIADHLEYARENAGVAQHLDRIMTRVPDGEEMATWLAGKTHRMGGIVSASRTEEQKARSFDCARTRRTRTDIVVAGGGRPCAHPVDQELPSAVAEGGQIARGNRRLRIEGYHDVELRQPPKEQRGVPTHAVAEDDSPPVALLTVAQPLCNASDIPRHAIDAKLIPSLREVSQEYRVAAQRRQGAQKLEWRYPDAGAMVDPTKGDDQDRRAGNHLHHGRL